MAKNATMSDYRRATGFEALMGYLYLTEQWERMLQLIKKGIEKEKRMEEKFQESKVEGRNAVLEAFRSGRVIDKLFVQEHCEDGPVRTILREAKKT